MTRTTALTLGIIATVLLGGPVMGQTQRLAMIDADPPEPTPCISDAAMFLTATPNPVALGQSSLVRWSVTPPPGCSGVRVQFNGATVAASGNRWITPSAPTTLRLTISGTFQGAFQERSISALVGVDYAARVVIDAATANPAAVLLGALASPNAQQTIELGCNVAIDLTGHTDILIGDGRTLKASPSCARGARQSGPRIFVTDERGASSLFLIRGDHVNISGFRLEGPTTGYAREGRQEKAIRIWPFSSALPIESIEISNMEIFNWAGLGVQVGDEDGNAIRGRLFNTRPEAARVTDSFFHDDLNVGEGYGVESTGGAYATFARNVFDNNRHAIAGGSRTQGSSDFSGYTARENLILPNGGVACNESGWLGVIGYLGNCWQTHQVDMHGDENRWYSDSNWQCGNAGETMIIQRNTILYTAGLAIKIRGNPVDKVVVDGNVFAHATEQDAIKQVEDCDGITRKIDVRPNNVYNANPMATLGRCDFAGDGLLDDFMATGVTWWARSPKTGQWRYLNTMSERLSQVLLQDVDGDGVCDVRRIAPLAFNVPVYSKSGTGPWTPVLVFGH